MSPATFTGYNCIMPTEREPSPGQRDDRHGPGWCSAAFFHPWAAGPPSPKYRWALFGTAAQAIGDLARCLDDGEAGERGPSAARLLRAVPRPGALAVHVDDSWACVVYEVGAGVHLSDAGDAFFAGWRTAWVDRRFGLINANRPVIC
ncbi:MULTISPECIES: hypothetical protein [unclassified Crossiella]|uniref:hypothetical protein n=1 Tax=unclassified Crossiella TaxID=2620835 RepID=UPI00200048D7|nr:MULTISPECIES: hypothetical protein [unclassified Crossiella]MCK2243560.1 hypothetical protein [Crossiella sp. S99.2]MCK2257418.1 hypothetical protein [Crossiella sp. S99.1]